MQTISVILKMQTNYDLAVQASHEEYLKLPF